MISCPITAWQIGGENVEIVTDFLFLGSRVMEDGDCSHEIRSQFLLGRKVMKNLDTVLKSRDITVSTKVHIVKAIVFPVVTYGCETLTVKKAECQIIDSFELWCWRKLLKVPLTARRSSESILIEINPKYSLEGLMLKLQYFGHIMQTDDSWNSPWCLERLKTEGEEDIRGWDGWMTSLMQWTWTLVSQTDMIRWPNNNNKPPCYSWDKRGKNIYLETNNNENSSKTMGSGREVGGGFRKGNMCTPVVDSCWCMAKPIQYCKVIIIIIKK